MRCLSLVTVPILLAFATASAIAADNAPPPGFTALFNGKDLTGWQGAIRIDQRQKLAADKDKLSVEQQQLNDKVFPHWKVEDGALVNDGKGGNLGTAKDYKDFELYLDWKIEPKGDSGVYLRGIPQVQIWDSDSLDMNRYKLEHGKGSGALWNNSKPEDKIPVKRADKAPGEWNTFHIIVKDGKATVKLNKELVAENVALENIWEKGKPIPDAGPVELQSHAKQDGTFGKIAFKNIYIKELN
jgi:hypothetical protein